MSASHIQRDTKEKKKKSRAALYIRVSTGHQVEEGYSLEFQERDMKEYCARRGWKVAEVYRDEGLSGRLTERPGLQRLLTDAGNGNFDVVVVFSVSRFYRKLESLLSALRFLRDLNISFISLKESIDFTNKWGKLILNILGTLAEIYVDELSESTSRGKEERASGKGLHNGSSPFGYCNGLCKKCTDLNGPGYCPRVGQPSIGDGEVLAPHPVDKHAVKLAFEWYASGEFSDADIAHKLNEYELELDGQIYKFRPKRPKLKKKGKRRYTIPRIFSKDSMRDILRRRFYIGLVEYRGGEGVAEERRKFKTSKVVRTGKHKAIISRILFEQAQAVRRQRGKAPVQAKDKKRNKVYPLSGILYSWPMQSKMRSVSNGSGKRLYRDRANIGKSRLDKASRSPQPTVAALPLEKQVQEVLDTLQLPPEWRQRILAYLIAPEKGIAEVEQKRRDIQARFERLRLLYQTGDYTRAEYNNKKAQLEAEMTRLLRPAGLKHERIDALLAELPALWRQTTPAELKDLFKTIFESIYVQGEEIVRLLPHRAFFDHLSDERKRLIHPDEAPEDNDFTLG